MCSHNTFHAGAGRCAWRAFTEALTVKSPVRFLSAALASAALVLSNQTANADAVLSAKTITWDVIGLDSNKPSTDGPVDFPLAVRVKNHGPDVANNVVIQAELLPGGNTHLNLIGLDEITTPSLAVGQVADFYFHVRIDRPPGNNNAQTAGYFSVLGNQNTTKRYKMYADADNATSVSTANKRQLFVEKILSQNRNSVAPMLTVDNPTLPFLAGQIRTFTLFSDTATGYDQQETSINFPNDIFQILSVQALYTDPACSCIIINEDQFVDELTTVTNHYLTNKVYVDGCGWVTDYTNPNYMTSNNSCTNNPLKIESPTGKIGGTIVTTYKVKILQNIVSQVDFDYLVHDHSGSSFHYNFEDDFFRIIPTNIMVAKTAPADPVEAGETFTYMLSVCNNGATAADDVGLTDTLPACIEYVSADPPPDTETAGSVSWNFGTLQPGLQNCIDVEITAVATCDLGDCVNYANVSTSDYETDYTDNEDSATLDIVDTTPPGITCPSNATLECPADLSTTANGTATATDNCPGTTVDYDDSFAPACGNTGTLTRVWTATDAAGNESSCTQTLTVVDTTDPSLTDVPDATVECTGNTSSSVTGVPSANDSCGTVSLTSMDGPMSDECGNTGAFTRTWTATDACGNTTSTEQLITIVDTTDPSLTDVPDATVECTDTTSSSATGVPLASDTCGPVTLSSLDGPLSNGCGNTGAFTRTWTATDDCGNSTSTEQLITIVDTTDPSLTDVLDATVECTDTTSSSATGVPMASDTCGPVTLTSSDSLPSDECGNTGSFTRTWTATDDCGNSTSTEQLITIVDTRDPSLTDVFDATVECTNTTSSSATGVPMASDTCGPVTLSSMDGPMSDGCGNTGSFTRTWTATDDCGNSTSTEQLITVVDTTDPSLTDVPDATVECNGNTSSSATGVPMTSDTCGPVTLSSMDGPLSNGCGNTGAFTRTWTATDECLNSTSTEQLITIVDTTPPMLTCPEDIAVSATSACVEVDYPDVIASDTCGSVSISFDPPEGTCFECGTTTDVVVTATDECGNETSCTFSITVDPCADGCSLTQGYWKNHPEDWPVSGLTLGTRFYTKAECIAILQTPVKKNGLIALAHQLIAAKLNVLEFADSSCVAATINGQPKTVAQIIALADAKINGLVIPPTNGSNDKLPTKQTSFLNNLLDDFNNGLICAPHCGDDLEPFPVSEKIF